MQGENTKTGPSDRSVAALGGDACSVLLPVEQRIDRPIYLLGDRDRNGGAKTEACAGIGNVEELALAQELARAGAVGAEFLGEGEASVFAAVGH